MSKQDEDPHLRRMFSHFVAKRIPPPGPSAPQGPPFYPSQTPPPPQPPPLLPQASSSALRRSASYAGNVAPSNTASNTGSYPARPPERRRSRPVAPGPSSGPGVPAYPPIPPMAPAPGSSLYRGYSSYEPQQRAPQHAPEPKSFPCPHCTSNFPSRGQLSRHVKRVHEKLKPFACEFCGRLFAARSDRSRHVGNMHKDGKKVG